MANHTKRQGVKKDIRTIHEEIDCEVDTQPREIGLIEAADNALKNRVMQRDQMQKFIEKKREMFLMQMTIDQKKEQIKQLEQTISIKTKGLEKAEMAIKGDLERFNRHLAEKKKDAQKLNEDASKVANEKTSLTKMLKNKKDEKATEISSNTKELETLDKLLRYKTFLDKLADTSTVTPHKEEELKELQVNEKLSKLHAEYRKFYPQGLLQPDMIKLLIDESHMYEPSFKATEDIKKKFIDMEEQNLKLIRNNQDAENEKDDLKQKLREMEAKYDTEIYSLTIKRDELRRKIEEKKLRNDELERVKIGNLKEIKVESCKLFEEIRKACKVVGIVKEAPPIELMTVAETHPGT